MTKSELEEKVAELETENAELKAKLETNNNASGVQTSPDVKAICEKCVLAQAKALICPVLRRR